MSAVILFQPLPFNSKGPSFPTTDYASKVSKAFVQICVEWEVQCTITMDTRNWRGIYQFKNLGDRIIRLRTNDRTVYLKNGEEFTVPIDDLLDALDYTEFQ